ncbi:MAG: 50S ribosomal protein L11 methyltransferase [Proteobacteria bacterium]|nr:50S ribosomal protein L11 methyltransferase [Pseudomonadota bacterium]
MRAATLWRAAVVVPAPTVPAFEDALAEDALASSCFELPGSPNWSVEALFEAPADCVELEMKLAARLALAADGWRLPTPRLSLAPLPDRDWVTASLRALAPVRAGRFFVHGAHDRGQAPAGAVALEVEAGRAFGNGRHETTNGCLLTLDQLAKRRRFHRPLDLGCGAGVLALAMSRLWRVPVIASDIDPWAVAVAKANSRKNNLHPWVHPVLADGFAHPALSLRAPYDLIMANILARPLQRLAPAIAAHLAPGGRVVLSGLLTKQDAQVRAAYRSQGLRLVRRRQIGGWVTLELAAPGP